MTRKQNIQIKGNTAADYQQFLELEFSEIPVYNSKAIWIQNSNCKNNYVLEKRYFFTGKCLIHVEKEIRIFGWTEEIMFGEKKGMIKATIPIIPNPEGDCEVIGYFDSVASAMASIIERNHPDCGIWI